MIRDVIGPSLVQRVTPLERRVAVIESRPQLLTRSTHVATAGLSVGVGPLKPNDVNYI
jgi:hypothetical protein